MREINFKRPRKSQLPEEPKTSQNLVQNLSVRLSVGIPDEKLLQLRQISPNAAIFTSLSSSKRDKPASDYDTVTAEENEDGLLPEPFTSLFDYNAINMEKVLLQEFAIKNSQFMNAVSTKIYLTESQNLQNHRASQMCGDCIE